MRGWYDGHPGLTVRNFLNYKRIENAHKVRKNIFAFYYVAVICTTTGEQNQLPIDDETRNDRYSILLSQVCGCVSPHPELPHQKTKQETSDASNF